MHPEETRNKDMKDVSSMANKGIWKWHMNSKHAGLPCQLKNSEFASGGKW